MSDIVTRQHTRTFDPFVRAYLECALWAAPQDGDIESPLDDVAVIDLPDETIEVAVTDCDAFRVQARAWLDEAGDDAHNGHDFFLTRNRHGAGFWDRGYGEAGRALTTIAHTFGEKNLYMGDDGLVYFEG